MLQPEPKALDYPSDKFVRMAVSSLRKLGGKRKAQAEIQILTYLHNLEFNSAMTVSNIPERPEHNVPTEQGSREADWNFCVGKINPVLNRLGEEMRTAAKLRILELLHTDSPLPSPGRTKAGPIVLDEWDDSLKAFWLLPLHKLSRLSS